MNDEPSVKDVALQIQIFLHEIRKPIGGIHGYLRILQKSDMSEEQQEDVRMALIWLDRLNGLVNGFADYRIKLDTPADDPTEGTQSLADS